MPNLEISEEKLENLEISEEKKANLGISSSYNIPPLEDDHLSARTIFSQDAGALIHRNNYLTGGLVQI